MKIIPDASTLSNWKKSSHSNNGEGACLEVADGFAGTVPVRDSKNPAGPALVFHVNAWSAFVDSLKNSPTA